MERNAGVDVEPGEEDGEGGVERALCKKSSKLEEELIVSYYHHHLRGENCKKLSKLEEIIRFILSSSSSERRVPEVAGVVVDHVDHPRANTEKCRQREN